MGIPELTNEQRRQALDRAMAARHERACFLARCKAGEVAPAEAIAAPVAQRVPVRRFLESFPGMGRAKAQAVKEACRIAASRRVRGLGCRQKAALIAKLNASYQAKQ